MKSSFFVKEEVHSIVPLPSHRDIGAILHALWVLILPKTYPPLLRWINFRKPQLLPDCRGGGDGMASKIENVDDREENDYEDQRKKNQALGLFFFGGAVCGNPMGSGGRRLFR